MVLYTDFLRGCVEMSRILQRGRVWARWWPSGRAGGPRGGRGPALRNPREDCDRCSYALAPVCNIRATDAVSIAVIKKN